MSDVIKFSILRSAADNSYRLAIGGVLLDQVTPLGKADVVITSHQLADILDMHTLVDMVDYKRECQKLSKLYFVSNRELSDWLEAKKGRRVVVVQPNQMINQGISHDTWPYDEDTAELNARNAGDIFVVEADSCVLSHLTRQEIGLDF